MRFKLDENMAGEVAELLRSRGHDASTVADEGLCGAHDDALASAVRDEQRTLATFDRDFSDVRAYPPREFAGLLVFRLARQDPEHLLPVWRQRLDVIPERGLAGELWIVVDSGVRRRVD